jgi:hypothetical protein
LTGKKLKLLIQQAVYRQGRCQKHHYCGNKQPKPEPAGLFFQEADLLLRGQSPAHSPDTPIVGGAAMGQLHHNIGLYGILFHDSLALLTKNTTGGILSSAFHAIHGHTSLYKRFIIVHQFFSFVKRKNKKPGKIQAFYLIREQIVDKLGRQNDDSDDHEDHQHANSHVLQIFHELHGIEDDLGVSLRGCQSGSEGVQKVHSQFLLRSGIRRTASG